MAETRARTLAQAAAMVFVLVAVLPLLIFTWALYTLDVIHSIEAELALILSLVIALLGFAVFRGMMHRLSESIRALRIGAQSKASAQNGSRPAAVVPAAPAMPTAPSVSQPKTPSVRTVTAPKAPRRENGVPAIGAVQEFSDLSVMMAGLWRDEAEAHRNQDVVVLLHSAFQPLKGRLTDVTDDGIVLDQGGRARAVSYRLISGIEARALAGAHR